MAVGKGFGQIVAGRGEGGVKFDGELELAEGPDRIPKPFQHGTQVVVGVGEVGVEFQGGFEVEFRLPELSVGGQRGPVGRVNFGGARVEVEGCFKLESGGGKWGGAGQQRRQIEVKSGEFGAQPKGLAKSGFGVLRVPGAEEGGAEVVV